LDVAPLLIWVGLGAEFVEQAAAVGKLTALIGACSSATVQSCLKTAATGVSSFTDPVLLALRPSKLSRRNANDLTELAGHMTLVRKPHSQCNLRQGEIRVSKHVLRSFDPFLREIVVRGNAGGLLKSSSEIMHR
jgi:hypothetical protein